MPPVRVEHHRNGWVDHLMPMASVMGAAAVRLGGDDAQRWRGTRADPSG